MLEYFRYCCEKNLVWKLKNVSYLISYETDCFVWMEQVLENGS